MRTTTAIVLSSVVTAAGIFGVQAYLSRNGMLCYVNEWNFVAEGWNQVQFFERPNLAYRKRRGEIDIEPMHNAIYCSWAAHEIPTSGALWYWKPIDEKVATNHKRG